MFDSNKAEDCSQITDELELLKQKNQALSEENEALKKLNLDLGKRIQACQNNVKDLTSKFKHLKN